MVLKPISTIGVLLSVSLFFVLLTTYTSAQSQPSIPPLLLYFHHTNPNEWIDSMEFGKEGIRPAQ